ncbi:hypothetical protein PENSTE_c012G04241 [Penicillium steckii]|uniref:LysM domain-containing protein n=1 Tax=Penicillium steckii TaxID=303698 RepID=A0A1V6T5U2_9EURO|nr:hypothetical protein PENSTE_c012G04241 [Penicillium steckii]
MDNNLPSHCRKFPKNGSLCIKNKCEVYTVKTGDTCSTVANAHNISTVQLRSYNLWINVGCYNFNRTIDTQICINEPGQKYIAPAYPSSPSSSSGGAASAAPVPSNIAPNTTTRCGEFYKVQPDEECDIFTVKFEISREDVGVLNPEINVNCMNLWENTSYCVQPVGNINSYPSAPGYVGPSSSMSKVAYTSLPDATYSPIFEFIPLAPNTREGCTMYVPGSDLQYNSTASSSCDIAGHYYNVSVKKLALWNPPLHLGSGSSNSTNTCSFSKSYRYCFRYPEASSTNVPGFGASTPLPSATKH